MKQIVATLLFIFLLQGLSAQNTGAIKGKIIDTTTGEPLYNISVNIEKTGVGTASDAKGKYHIKNITDGKHTIIFSAIGYQAKSEEIIVEKGKTTVVDIRLSEAFEDLGEVLISAKSEARKIREQAMPISVISMNEIQGTVSDINEVLAKTSGVKLRNTGGVGSSSRISVRGLEGKRIGYFIDETPMNDNSDFMDLNDIPVDMIDRIEIYKGIVPAKLGGSAIGGAVNIVLKEYPPKYMDLSYTFASFNTHKTSTVLKSNKNGYEFGIGGFYTYSDNDYKMELPLKKGTFIKRDHDRFQKYTIGGSLKAKENKWWFDKVEIEPAITFTKKQIQGIEYNIQEARSFANALFVALKTEKKDFFTPGLDYDFDISYAYTVFKFQDKSLFRYKWDGSKEPTTKEYGGEIGTYPSDATNKKHTGMGKLNLNYLLNEWSSINLNSTLNLAKGLPKDDLKDKAADRKTSYDSKMLSWVTGLNYETRFFDNKLTNSLTGKYYQYSIKTKLVELFSGKTMDIDMLKSNWGINNAIRYRFSPEFLVKLSAAYDVRLPAENELLGDGFLIVPSGNLVPERNTSFNLGFMYDKSFSNKRRFQFEINGFYMYLENMIRFVGGPLQSNYSNFGEMRTIGGDVEIKWDAADFLYIYANATYQDLRDMREYEPGSTVENTTKGSRMPNIPYLFANAGFELHKENLLGGVGHNSRLFASGSFVEEYFYDFEQSIHQTHRIPRTLTIDMGLEHSFNNQRIIIGFQMNNITDENVISEFNRPLPGRNFALKLRYIFK